MSKLLSEADILFPHLSNTPNLSSTLSSLRRLALSTHNRLTSIISDSSFVTSVGSAYSLPLVANERCGSWYIPPGQKSGSVYFKSTDGHMGEWGFSLRRLNLQLLDVVEKWGGAVVVDSTRRGKSMPDALSKTVPVWCCVVNRAVFGEEGELMGLFTPPQAVGESEHVQMERRIDGFVRQFLVRVLSIPFHPTLIKLRLVKGYLQTKHPAPPQQTQETPTATLGNAAILPPGLTTLFPGFPSHRSLHSIATCPRR
jgi:tRNA A64-2'-O-ribosylphosphate transferase